MSLLTKDSLAFTDENGRVFTLGYLNPNANTDFTYEEAAAKTHFIPVFTRGYCVNVVDYRTVDISGYVSNVLSRFRFVISNVTTSNQSAAVTYLQNNVLTKVVTVSNVTWNGSAYEAVVRLEGDALSDLL